MTKHTPTPWMIIRELGNTAICTSPDDEHAIINCWPDDAPTTGEEAIANTLHIVKCVNAHDALVEAIDYLLTAAEPEGMAIAVHKAREALKLAGAA